MFKSTSFNPNGGSSSVPKILSPGTHFCRILDMKLETPPYNTEAYSINLLVEGEDQGDGETRDLLNLTQMVALMSMLEGREDGEPDAVKLSTLHAAKGLEWDRVFLIGVGEGYLPYPDAPVEEELRLFYVGITRARAHLHMSHGGAPSLFLRSITNS